MSHPLSGVRVIELDAGIAVATAGALLRDAGATVIKVEAPSGDASRHFPGHYGWNRGKQSIVLEPGPSHSSTLHTLLATADAVVVGGSGEALDGYTHLDGQVIVRAPAYTGALAHSSLVEDDALASALSGVLGGTGAYRPGPAFPVLPTLSYAVGATVAGAVSAALYVRQKTGRGQQVDVGWPTIGAYLAGYQASESDRIPLLPGGGGASPQGLNIGWHIYRATDGWVGVACPNPSFFNRLLACINRAELLSDPRFQMAPFIAPKDREAVTSILQEAFAARSMAEWTARFEEFGVPGAELLVRDEFVASNLVAENRMVATVKDPQVGKVRQVARPFVLGGLELPAAASAPPLGRDTEAVLASLSDAPATDDRVVQTSLPAHPLEGVRVLDFTGYLAGPTAGRMLADLGAEVIKVEPPEGEGLRGAGLTCVGINVGKKSVAIDSKKPQGREVIERLMKSADVLLHALIPGAPEKLGLDYETVRQINPRLVYCWISGFGEAKAWHGRPSFDLLLQALSGQMLSLGSPEQPVYSSIPMADLYAGMTAVYGIMLGLSQRERTGEGMFVSTNQVAASMGAQQGEFVDFEGVPKPSITVNALGANACYRYYASNDGWVILAVHDADGWERLVEHYPSELGDWSRWDTAGQEPAEGALADALAAIFASISRQEVYERLTSRGVPCAPVVIVREDRLTNAYFEQLQVLNRDVTHVRFGNITTVGGFYRFSLTPARTQRLAQWVGDQNREVLRSIGYSDEEIDQLGEAGAIAAPELRMAGV